MKKLYYSLNFKVLFTVCLLIFLVADSSYGETVADFDGDGKTDVLVRRRDGQDGRLHWYALKSGNGSFSATQWGFNPADTNPPQQDNPVLGDFDGDGKRTSAFFAELLRPERCRIISLSCAAAIR